SGASGQSNATLIPLAGAPISFGNAAHGTFFIPPVRFPPVHNASMPLAVRIAASVVFFLAVASTAQAEDGAAPSFVNDVVPLLTRLGCNSGACHGKLAGQAGFRLSLRGYAPEL